MKVTINLRGMVAEKIGGTVSVPSTIDIEEVFDFIDFDDEQEVDIHDLLAEQKAVGLVFTIADVKKLRPDLTDEQAWEVLQMFEVAAEDCPDPLHETISQIADMHYPKRRKAKPSEVAKIIADYGNGCERENLVDLLTDTMHWCKGFGEPFEEFSSSAAVHFDEETEKGA
jgi:hypothetical protein